MLEETDSVKDEITLLVTAQIKNWNGSKQYSSEAGKGSGGSWGDVGTILSDGFDWDSWSGGDSDWVLWVRNKLLHGPNYHKKLDFVSESAEWLVLMYWLVQGRRKMFF